MNLKNILLFVGIAPDNQGFCIDKEHKFHNFRSFSVEMIAGILVLSKFGFKTIRPILVL